MTDTLQAGDTVAIKSHPEYLMTVEFLNGGEATCCWFHSVTGDYKVSLINVKALMKIR